MKTSLRVVSCTLLAGVLMAIKILSPLLYTDTTKTPAPPFEPSSSSPSTSPLAANIDVVAPPLYTEHAFTWITENQKTTKALFRCIERGNCAQNQTKGEGDPRGAAVSKLTRPSPSLVVITTSWHFRWALEGGYFGGEAIWALSTVYILYFYPISF